ncbi:MAG: hypothetical protein M3680_07445 [Myxococcota bacterium]|nr:hypothetical protein [Myxococcota bacterium]
MKRVLLLAACAACGSFEDEDVVIDTRVLAMAAELPEQVVDVDFENPSETELLGQLQRSRMCALVADPAHERGLRWSMTLCVLTNDERCDEDLPALGIGAGRSADPELGLAADAEICSVIEPDGNLLGILRAAFEADSFSGLGGLDYGVSLIVRGEDVDPALDLYAGKTLRVSPRIPAARTANTNPTLEQLEISIDGADPIALPLGRCIDQLTPLVVGPRALARITPIERADTREVYVVPTLDGQSQTFTESPTYQWVAGAGGYSSGSTGGPRDFSGNPAPLFTEWRAPDEDDLAGATLDVPLWIVQRDERLGAAWYESCLRVVR